jgi:hypothetical protein
MHLKHTGIAILYVAAMRQFRLTCLHSLNFLPKRKHSLLAVPFGTAFFLRSVTLVIVVDMRFVHNGNAAVCDEIYPNK